MNDETIALDVTLLGRPYRFSCRESEREALIAAVDLLERRMREIRDAGKVAGAERIAVMAALNMAHELLDLKTAPQPGLSGADLQRRILAMRQAIDHAIAEQQERLF